MDTLCWKRGRVGSKGTHAQEEACPVPHAAHGTGSACVSAEEMHVGLLFCCVHSSSVGSSVLAGCVYVWQRGCCAAQTEVQHQHTLQKRAKERACVRCGDVLCWSVCVALF